jgi:hypothetical protein
MGDISSVSEFSLYFKLVEWVIFPALVNSLYIFKLVEWVIFPALVNSLYILSL